MHTFKPIYDTKDSNKFGRKFYFSFLYMPKSCRMFFKTMRPESAYSKKKDAENHISLLAIKKLHELKLLDDHFYPSFNNSINKEKQLEI